MELTTLLFFYTYYYVRPAVILACLILGIIILCTKDRTTRLLGIWIIIGEISNLVSALSMTFIRYMESVSFCAKFVSVINIATSVMSLASAVVFFLYANRRYGTKIYTGIILIAARASGFFLLRFLFSKMFRIDTFAEPSRYGYIMNILSLLPGLAVATVWFIIFLKNRYKEPELKLLWLITLSMVIFAAADLVLNLCCCISASVSDSVYTIQMLDAIVEVIVSLLLYVYILVAGRKSSDDMKLEIV